MGLAVSLLAADPDRDFAGKWVLDSATSKTASLGKVETSLDVSQSDAGILYSAGSVSGSYALDGSETRRRVGDETRSSATKWEGSALLINTLVSGPQSYTVMDRWKLSASHDTLTITRHIVRVGSEVEGSLVFRHEGAISAAPAPSLREAPTVTATRSAPSDDNARPAFAKRPEPNTARQSIDPEIVVPTGTRVLLQLIGEVSTKHAREGDQVYLRTAVPVAADGQVVIPRGSDVTGTITRTKPAGKVAGKGELFIRFDSLILPNGVSRDFRARPPGSEGKVDGDGKAADGRTVMEGAGMGATVGALTRGLPGAAVGGAAGAIAGVLLSRNQDVVLRQGTHLEMVLDRDLVFHPGELLPSR
ncbi:MAG TPA: hypothetical protein VGN17_28035 [Bryobacteraceae bacterium]